MHFLVSNILRHTDAASVIPTISQSGGTKTDSLVLSRKSALHAHSLVSILHNHRVFLNDNMVDIAATILKTKIENGVIH